MPVPEHTDHAPAADDRAAGAPEVAMPAVFETLAAERRPDAAAALDAVADAPVQLAVFDFDGTSIAGNSPVLLFLDLAKHNLLANSVMLRILLWAAAYKFRLPQNESWVRSLVFSAFEGHPVEEVDQYLADFYDRDIAPLFRPEADAAMREHAAAGHVVVVISATFEPIILRAREHHPFENQVSTRMRVAPDGGGAEARGPDGLRRRALRRGELGAGVRLRRPPFRPRPALRRHARLRRRP